MRKLAAFVSCAVAIFIACGGETPQPNNNPNADASAPTPSATTSSTAANTADAGPPAIDSQKDPFIEICMRAMPAQDYCSCAWEQFRDAMKDADLTQKPSDAQLMQMKQRTQQTCAPKLTDAEVKPVIINACLNGEPKKQPFCDCQWTEFRKKLDVADFVGEGSGPKFDDAKKSMAKACKGKLPEELAHKDFSGGCLKAAPGKDKACECMWKKVRAKATPEEIVADIVDTKSLGLEACLKL